MCHCALLTRVERLMDERKIVRDLDLRISEMLLFGVIFMVLYFFSTIIQKYRSTLSRMSTYVATK